MRVLFVTPAEPAGPHLPFVRREAHALRNAGHPVEMFAFDDSRSSPGYFIARAAELRAAVRRFRPDVVHAQLGRLNALAAARRAAGGGGAVQAGWVAPEDLRHDMNAVGCLLVTSKTGG